MRPKSHGAIRRSTHPLNGYVERLENFELDPDFAALVLAEMDANEEFDRAVRSFNEANTDRSALSEAQELVSTVSAFQQLLGIRNGNTRDTTEAFVRLLSCIVPAGTPAPEKPKVKERVARGRSLREAWMDDLGVLRGNVGHGHALTAYPSAWTAQEHLLLAAYLFPLLAKVRLAAANRRALTESEEDDVSIFDLMLASGNLLAASEVEHGIALSHSWGDVRRDGLREARIRRVVAAMD